MGPSDEELPIVSTLSEVCGTLKTCYKSGLTKSRRLGIVAESDETKLRILHQNG